MTTEMVRAIYTVNNVSYRVLARPTNRKLPDNVKSMGFIHRITEMDPDDFPDLPEDMETRDIKSYKTNKLKQKLS